MKLKADIAIIDIIIHLIIWLLLSIITFGIALIFAPYSFSKFIINRTAIIDANGAEHPLKCDIDLFGNIGHMLLWFIISILTLGIGYLFYTYRVWNYALNSSTTEAIS